MITVTVNGRQVTLDGPTALLDYLAQLGVDSRAVAVEINGTILQRDAYAAALLRDRDAVEIVRMVGGGCYRRRRRALNMPWRESASPPS